MEKERKTNDSSSKKRKLITPQTLKDKKRKIIDELTEKDYFIFHNARSNSYEGLLFLLKSDRSVEMQYVSRYMTPQSNANLVLPRHSMYNNDDEIGIFIYNPSIVYFKVKIIPHNKV
jgi:hypothetical protein